MEDRPRYINLILVFVFVFSALGLVPKEVNAAASELFFSEYIEGSSFNKALEIYNGTGSSVDLSTYSLELYSNGASSPSQTTTLSGTLNNDDVFVIAHASADAAILAVADSTNSSVINHNGDDALVLKNSGVIVDVFGKIGEDPGSYWGTPPDTTQNHTLVRLDYICSGDTDGSDNFDPAAEWITFDEDTFSELGDHTAICGPTPTPEPKINEFVADHDDSDTLEFVEIFGEPDTDYSDHTLLQIEGDSTGAGVIDTVLTVGTTDSNGIWWSGYLTNEFENGTMTLLLVEGFTGSDGNDLDTDNDGSFETTPWDAVIDSVGVTDGGSSDRNYGLPVLSANYDGNSYQPGGASRIPDGFDTETVSDWVRNGYYPGEIPDVGDAYNTPGELNSVNACGGDFTPIYDIQGSGDITPLEGYDVVSEGIVVGDFQADGFVDDTKNGFYMQDATGDGDPSTSDGIFVYYYGTDVQVGDYVRVAGEAMEFNGLTELGYIDSVVVCDVDQPLPAPTVVSLPVASVGDWEAYEGMYVTFPQDLVVSEYFNFDRYGEIVLTSQRYMQFTAVNEPDIAGYAASNEAYRLNSITLDDGLTGQNPDPAIHPNSLEFNLYNRFRGGDLVTNLTGIMDYGFGQYRLQPTEGADYTPANPRTETPDILEGDIKVASLNVYNYFTTIDTKDWICSPSEDQECRGADTAEELERQRAKIIAALAEIDADIVGLMEIENDRPDPDPDYAVADLVDGLNDMLGAGTYDYIATGAIGTDAIKVAMIYQPGEVTPVGDYAILDSTVDARFLDDYNRPVLAQSFEDNIIGETITVAVNHLKSKGSDCEDVSDPDVGDGQGNCNLTRLDAAQAEVDWLATDPTGSSSDYFMIIGDLNAYDKEDPIDAVKAGSDDTLGTDDDYLDLIYEFLGEDAYSYLFDGRIGYLDYAMANMALAEFVADVAVWHINADEPDILDYDMSFKKPPQDAIFAPDAFRASDHDPVIVTLTFNQGPGAINDYYVTNQDVPLDVPVPGVLENDFDLNQYDEISIEVLIWPKYGELTLGLNGDGEWDGSFSYVPYPGFFGQDGFAYRMYAFPPDRAEFSDEALVIIDVKPAHQYFMPFIKNP